MVQAASVDRVGAGAVARDVAGAVDAKVGSAVGAVSASFDDDLVRARVFRRIAVAAAAGGQSQK